MMNVAVVGDSFVGSNNDWILDVTIVMDDTASMQSVFREPFGRAAYLLRSHCT